MILIFMRVFFLCLASTFFWFPAVGKQGDVLTSFSESFSGNGNHWKGDPSGRVVSPLFKLDDLRINLRRLEIVSPFFKQINIFCP